MHGALGCGGCPLSLLNTNRACFNYKAPNAAGTLGAQLVLGAPPLMLHSDHLLHHDLSGHYRRSVDGTVVREGSRGSELPSVSPTGLRD